MAGCCRSQTFRESGCRGFSKLRSSARLIRVRCVSAHMAGISSYGLRNKYIFSRCFAVQTFFFPLLQLHAHVNIDRIHRRFLETSIWTRSTYITGGSKHAEDRCLHYHNAVAGWHHKEECAGHVPRSSGHDRPEPISRGTIQVQTT